ncbi:MAG TPA: phosphate/phosphite/phosphonate ABC transporter substrate-binding protein [Aggregatilineales bacterium]|nr:phosphate/phosphite/phosphonate ABC transporter substrate-binding protein [Aggregatilineales bacterium]
MRTKSLFYPTTFTAILLALTVLTVAGQPGATLAQSSATEAASATMAGTPAPYTLGAPCPTTADAAPAATTAATQDTGASTPAATAPAEVGAENGTVYKFGLTPWQKGQSEDDVRFLFKPMLEWLGKQVNATFVLVSAKDYAQAADYIANNTVQFVNISPAPYIAAQKKTPGVRMLVTELSCNKANNTLSDSYTGYILALKTRTDLNSVDDLKGKNFAFVALDSTSGYVVPNALLFKSKGIDPKDFFAQVTFPGSHPLVTDAIVAGSVDAGATWDFNWSQAILKHGDVFKAIWTSPPIPNVGIAINPSVPEDMQKKVQDALLHIDPALLKGLSPSAYVARPDSFYDVIRQLQAGN